MLAAKITLSPQPSELRSKIPFDSQYKYMSTLYRLGEEEVVLVTGAPDVLFPPVPVSAERQRVAAAGSPVLGKQN